MLIGASSLMAVSFSSSSSASNASESMVLAGWPDDFLDGRVIGFVAFAESLIVRSGRGISEKIRNVELQEMEN